MFSVASVKVIFIYFVLRKALHFPFGPKLEQGLQAEALALAGFLKGPWAPESCRGLA